MSEAAIPNSRAALIERRAAGVLTWSGPALMLFARSAFAVAAQGLVAVLYASLGSATPWRGAGGWLPVYGTLIDEGCLFFLWRLARREGITLRDLIGFDRKRLGRDVLLGLALTRPSLLLILGGNATASLLVYGSIDAPQVFAPLPLLPALYAVLVFPWSGASSSRRPITAICCRDSRRCREARYLPWRSWPFPGRRNMR